MGYKVAVVGATGNAGREMMDILAERAFPPTRWWRWSAALKQARAPTSRSVTLKCKALEHYDFADVHICLMSAGSSVSKEWSPRIAAAGAAVIGQFLVLARPR